MDSFLIPLQLGQGNTRPWGEGSLGWKRLDMGRWEMEHEGQSLPFIQRQAGCHVLSR